MADIIDDADKASETFLQSALSQKREDSPPFIGACHNCNQTLFVGLWCDTDCRDDWEKRKRANKNQPIFDED